MLVIAGSAVANGAGCDEPTTEPQRQGAHKIADAVADVAKDQAVKLPQSLCGIRVFCGAHFPRNKGMAADGPLTKNHQIPGKNIRTFHGDADRHAHIGMGQIVAWAHDKPPSGMDIHGVLDHPAGLLCHMKLGNGGNDGRFDVIVHGAGRDNAGGLQLIGMACDTRHGLLNPLKIADGEIELHAQACVGSGQAVTQFAGGGAQCRQ